MSYLDQVNDGMGEQDPGAKVDKKTFRRYNIDDSTGKNGRFNPQRAKDDSALLPSERLRCRLQLRNVSDASKLSRCENLYDTDTAAILNSLKINLNGLSSAQKSVVLKYCTQMLQNDDKESFVTEVGNAMAFLYRENIESCIPEVIEEHNKGSVPYPHWGDAIWGANAKKMRKDIDGFLKNAMKKYGTDYYPIGQYLTGQQCGSWEPASRCLRGFYLEQKRDLSKGKNYHFSASYRKLGVDDLIRELHEKYPDQEQYKKSVALYQAMTGIALNRIKDIPGVNKKNNTLVVYRGTGRHTHWGPQGALESTSLVGLNRNFVDENNLRITVPFSGVKVLYFLSSAFCNNFYVNEREVLCDLNNAIIEKLESPEKYIVPTVTPILVKLPTDSHINIAAKPLTEPLDPDENDAI